MGRSKGIFDLAANFQVKTQDALDARLVVKTKADLISKENWPHDGDTLYLYETMIVGVIEEHAAYMLIDIDKALATDYSGWLKLCGGSGTGEGVGNIDPELLEAYMPLSRDFSDDFNNDFTR